MSLGVLGLVLERERERERERESFFRNLTGHTSARQIRASMSSIVSEDLGPTPKNDDFTEMVSRIQERDTERRHNNKSEFPGPTAIARSIAYKKYVRDNYQALVSQRQTAHVY